jgi:hypothetical protein
MSRGLSGINASIVTTASALTQCGSTTGTNMTPSVTRHGGFR